MGIRQNLYSLDRLGKDLHGNKAVAEERDFYAERDCSEGEKCDRNAERAEGIACHEIRHSPDGSICRTARDREYCYDRKNDVAEQKSLRQECEEVKSPRKDAGCKRTNDMERDKNDSK